MSERDKIEQLKKALKDVLDGLDWLDNEYDFYAHLQSSGNYEEEKVKFFSPIERAKKLIKRTNNGDI